MLQLSLAIPISCYQFHNFSCKISSHHNITIRLIDNQSKQANSKENNRIKKGKIKKESMADTDEAAIHLSSSHDSGPQVETDLSDETQDFRFLNHIV